MPGGGSLSKHLLGGSERVSELRWRRRLERNVASLPEGMTRKREEKVERVCGCESECVTQAWSVVVAGARGEGCSDCGQRALLSPSVELGLLNPPHVHKSQPVRNYQELSAVHSSCQLKTALG